MQQFINTNRKEIPPTFSQDAISFHRQLPNYIPTPLVDWQVYASQHHLKNLFIKDESQRLGLKSFKGLGTSYAMFRILCERNHLDPQTTSLAKLRTMDHSKVTFVCASHGNQGVAMAWATSLFGCSSYLLIPKGSSKTYQNQIKRKNVQVVITDGSYDQAIQKARAWAKDNDGILLQDIAWDGYTKIPTWIIEGYLTMAKEIQQQISTTPTHIFLQAGTGAMAGGMIDAFHHMYPKAQLIIVQPLSSPCLYVSMEQTKRSSVVCQPTIMTHLNRGIPCLITWPIIQKQVNCICICEDDAAIRGMHVLKTNDIISGPSGALTMGLVDRIVKSDALRNQFQIQQDASILLINTEGDTDPFFYQSMVGEDRCLII